MTNLTSGITTSSGGNLTLIENPDLCTLQTCDLSLANFTYIPDLASNATYLALLALLIPIQLGLGIRYKTWGFMISMFLGLVTEVIGYVGRILLHNNPFNNNAFLIYLICLTIAPAFITAAIYLCLARIIVVYGASFSRFHPRTYTLVFCGCDFFSLVLQGAGGGLAASSNSQSGKDSGKNVMVAGLAFQCASLILFAGCCAEFAWRCMNNKGSWNPRFTRLVNSALFKSFLFGLIIAVITIFTRSVFRVAELSGGFNGSLFNDQTTFMILEGPMIIAACLALTLLHPGIAFQGAWLEANFAWRWWGNKEIKSENDYSTDEELKN